MLVPAYSVICSCPILPSFFVLIYLQRRCFRVRSRRCLKRIDRSARGSYTNERDEARAGERKTHGGREKERVSLPRFSPSCCPAGIRARHRRLPIPIRPSPSGVPPSRRKARCRTPPSVSSHSDPAHSPSRPIPAERLRQVTPRILSIFIFDLSLSLFPSRPRSPFRRLSLALATSRSPSLSPSVSPSLSPHSPFRPVSRPLNPPPSPLTSPFRHCK
ncbi:hypothetical protein ACLOJK_013540 [Asimina triloba]